MSKLNPLCVAVLFAFAAVPCLALAKEGAAAPANRGETLFQSYGCGNCHGQDGATPVSKYVPSLKGKPAAQVAGNADAIFRGSRVDGHARLMHSQYCSPGDETATCPSIADLQVIAEWLASSPLPEKKQTPQGLYLMSAEAFEMVRAQPGKVLFLDVRTPEELAFLGMPTVADANVPFVVTRSLDEWDEKESNFKLHANSKFLGQVEQALKRKGLSREDPIILLCRSGDRSSKAARVLHVAGYDKVYSVVDGFEGDKADAGPLKGQRMVNGWRNAGLPWSYKLDREKMHWTWD